MDNTINNFEQKGLNLWKYQGKYYRLYAIGITPNGCWLIAPKMKELIDINIATGKDIMGKHIIEFDVCGTVQADHTYIMEKYKN